MTEGGGGAGCITSGPSRPSLAARSRMRRGSQFRGSRLGGRGGELCFLSRPGSSPPMHHHHDHHHHLLLACRRLSPAAHLVPVIPCRAPPPTPRPSGGALAEASCTRTEPFFSSAFKMHRPLPVSKQKSVLLTFRRFPFFLLQFLFFSFDNIKSCFIV